MLVFVNISYGQKMNIEVDSKAKAYAIDSIEINAQLAVAAQINRHGRSV